MHFCFFGSKLNEVMEGTQCVYKLMNNVNFQIFIFTSIQVHLSGCYLAFRIARDKCSEVETKECKGSLRQGISNKTASELNFNRR